MSLHRVRVAEDVFRACTVHSLTTEKEEIMGLLLGDILEEKLDEQTTHDPLQNKQLVAHVWALSIQVRSDKQRDRVELSPQAVSLASEEADRLSRELGRPTRVIGWYHSHPQFTVFPSHVDLRTQLEHQFLDAGFVGLIFGCFNKNPFHGQRFEMIAFQSAEKEHSL